MAAKRLHWTCQYDDCRREHYARGLCRRHWRQRQERAARGVPEDERLTPIRTPVASGRWPTPRRMCSEPGCTRVHQAKGLCRIHYQARRARDLRRAARSGKRGDVDQR